MNNLQITKPWWWDQYVAPIRPDPPIDPVKHAIAQGHLVAVDLLTEILKATTPSRALQIQQLIKPLVQTLESIELCALNRADDLNGGGQ